MSEDFFTTETAPLNAWGRKRENAEMIGAEKPKNCGFRASRIGKNPIPVFTGKADRQTWRVLRIR